MANKKEVLTIEEKLEKAVVPDWEQPYKVPSNWVWTRLDVLGDFGMGQTILSKNLIENGVPVYSATEEDKIFGYIAESDNKINLTNKDLVIPARGNSIGYVKYIDVIKASCTQTTMFMRVHEKNISKYLYYYMKCFKDTLFIYSGNAIPQITISNIKTKEVSLPPLAEQQRIVDRIESLFSKLDEAKEKTQAALDSFETRKAAILHKAFTGELTQKWREKNGVELDSWSIMDFSQVAKIKSNLVQPSEFMDFPHIAPDNIEKKTGVLLDFNSIREDGVTSGKHRFYAGQILYSKIRPYLSKVVMVDFDGLCSADMYPIEANEDTKYLWYFMLSEFFLEQASNAGSRSVLPKINQKEMASIKVSMCSLPEQIEIVRILDSIFEKEKQAKELASVIEKIDLMKKAILARAFRGELGTNDPEEESAVELLKEILKEA